MNNFVIKRVAARYLKASKTFYHGTSIKAAERILSQGFSLASVGQRQRALYQGKDTLDPKGVFITSDLQQAKWYAGPDPTKPGLNRGGAVLEVKVSGRLMSEKNWRSLQKRIKDEMGITNLFDPKGGEALLLAQREVQQQGYVGFQDNDVEYVILDIRKIKPIRAFYASGLYGGDPLPSSPDW